MDRLFVALHIRFVFKPKSSGKQSNKIYKVTTPLFFFSCDIL